MSEPLKIAPQPWMQDAATRRVMAALIDGGAEARFVGGCVRDALLERSVRDVDIATPAPPERVIELLEAAGIKAIPTGIEHGTVTAVTGAAHFEITTLRVDVRSHGRRADVAFTEDWDADAARRDFTINALSLTPDGVVHDPFGGLEDLKTGRVRFVGDAETRIREDVLRLLRYFRFFAWYDRPPPDDEAIAAAGKLAHLLPTLSGERVWGEFRRLLAAPDPVPVLRLMAAEGVLAHVLAEAKRFDVLAALVAVEETEGLAGEGADPVRRLAAVLDADAAGIGDVSDRLRLARRDRNRLAWLTEDDAAVPPDLGARAARRMIYRYGTETFRDLVLLSWAAARADAAGGPGGPGPDRAQGVDYAELLGIAACWTPPVCPVAGRDAVELGLPPGPEVGAALARVENWWMDEDFAPDRAACLEKLKSVLGKG